MKQIYSTLFFALISFMSFSQTFDWETGIDTENGVVQTVDGITATFTTFSNSHSILNGFGFAGSSGNVVFATNQTTSVTVSFSAPVNIATVFGLDADASIGSTWTFTPSGGSNSSVDQFISSSTGATVTLNWTSVNSFTITSSQGNESFGLDDIVLSSTLNINNATTNNVKIYPNPSSQFIQISNINSNESYTIFSIFGNKIKNGIISNNTQIDISNFANGIYLLKFDSGNTIKFIKN
jgi:hypothetical protein